MKLDTSITLANNKSISTKAGIYRIINIINDKYYLGSSLNISNRISSHKHLLFNNKHKNKYLQAAFNKYGINNFVVEVLEIIPDNEITDNQYVTDVEQQWLDAYMPYLKENGYNLCQFVRSRLGVPFNTTELTKYREGSLSSELKINKKSFRSKRDILGRNARSTFHRFINPDGDLHEFYNLQEFCRLNNLQQAAMQRVEIGKQSHHVGWTIPEGRQYYLENILPNLNKSYIVISPNNEEYLVTSVRGFAIANKLDPAAFHRVLTNKQSTHKGWKLKPSE